MKKILIISPHPDDEVLGCGGTIAKHVEGGDEVYLCIITKAYTPDWSEQFMSQREAEIKKSTKILGIKQTFFLNFPTVKLDTIPQKELNDRLGSIVQEVQPDVAYIPHKGDLNKDHRIVFEASLVAMRPKANQSIQCVLSYEVPSETEWGEALSHFVPQVYSDVTNTMSVKLEAMKAYASELRVYPHPRSLEGIEALAKKRGTEAHLQFAEAFMLVREIIF